MVLCRIGKAGSLGKRSSEDTDGERRGKRDVLKLNPPFSVTSIYVSDNFRRFHFFLLVLWPAMVCLSRGLVRVFLSNASFFGVMVKSAVSWWRLLLFVIPLVRVIGFVFEGYWGSLGFSNTGDAFEIWGKSSVLLMVALMLYSFPSAFASLLFETCEKELCFVSL